MAVHDDYASSLRYLRAGLPGPDTVETYVLDPDEYGDAPPDELNRINGMPVGVTDARWPLDEDRRRYAHVCTLDLATMPAVAAAAPGFRAAVLFVYDPARDAGGDDPHFVHRWVMLSDAEAARGVVATPDLPGWGSEAYEPARPFSVHAIHVPRAVFDTTLAEHEPRRVTRTRLALTTLHGRAGGGAVHHARTLAWPPDAFFLQVDTQFGGLSVGKGGFAYVERSRMFWLPDAP